MAETLSAVASGIAVVQVTVSLCTAISKLKGLWEEVKEVPETIRILLNKIEIVEATLSCFESSLRNESFRRIVESDVSLARSVQHCRKATETLLGLVDSLNNEIESSRRVHRGVQKIKVLSKKDTLSIYERRLSDAVQLLLVAGQGYMMYVHVCVSRTRAWG